MVVISPDGADVYTQGYFGPIVSQFRRHASSGALSFDSCMGNSPSCSPLPAPVPADLLVQGQVLAISPDGLTVYAGAREYASISSLPRDPTTGKLTFRSCIAVGALGGCSSLPAGVTALDGLRGRPAISPDGQTLAVAGYGANAVASFTRVVADCSGAALDATAGGSHPVDLVCRDGAGVRIPVEIVSQPSHGTLTVDPVTGTGSYVPDHDYGGPDTATFRVSGIPGASNTATLTIAVARPPRFEPEPDPGAGPAPVAGVAPPTLTPPGPPPAGPAPGASCMTIRVGVKPSSPGRRPARRGRRVPAILTRVTATHPATLRVTATARVRLGKHTKRVTLGRVTVRAGNQVRIVLPKQFRKRLPVGRRLRVTFVVKTTPASPRVCPRKPHRRTIRLRVGLTPRR